MLPVPKVWNLMAAEGSRGQPRLLCVPSIFDGDHLTNAAVARKKSVELQSPDLALSSLTRRAAAGGGPPTRALAAALAACSRHADC